MHLSEASPMKQRKVKHIHVKNSIYDGTMLEGLPINFKWNYKRPKTTYEVTDKGINMYCYRTWMNIEDQNDRYGLQRMFLHDTCHALLYFERGEHEKVFTNDFGLSWDSSEHNDEGSFWKSYPELMDEFKIVMLSFMLQDHVAGREYKHPFEYVASVKPVLEKTHLLGEDLKDERTYIRKDSMLHTAAHYWLNGRLDKIHDTIKGMSELIRDRYKKASD
jgi:hypothetical protein